MRILPPAGRRLRRAAAILTAVAATAGFGLVQPAASAAPQPHSAPTVQQPGTYTNPMTLNLPGGFHAASCADPDVIRGSGTDTSWYLFCTSDRGTDAPGGPDPGLLPIYRSTDLVHWTWLHASIPTSPSYAATGAGIWAPNIVRASDGYRLYFAVSNTNLPGGGAAIGVATGPTPAGPFTVSQSPVVEPSNIPGTNSRRSTIDPEVVSENGQNYIAYGGFGGGLWIRKLSADGTTSDPASEQRLAVGDRYEGSYLTRHGAWWYLLASSTNCCNGPLTGYTVFAARSKTLLGTFRDATGRAVTAPRVGGTPVVAQNGNRWVGVGHNTMLTDYAGQDWLIYHGIDQNDPYYQGAVGYTKRPGLIDPLDWVDGWPSVRSGRGPSDTPQPAPAAQPGQRAVYRPRPLHEPQPGQPIRDLSDDFSGSRLSSQWSWIREPAADSYSVGGGSLRWQTQSADIQPPSAALASVLTEKAPSGDYMVETKVSVNTPNDFSVHNYVQGGMLIYNSDATYVKLGSVSIGTTRQTEIGKHVSPQPGYPSYGNGVVGPVGDWTYLRLVARTCGSTTCYTAFSSLDGDTWVKGATWQQDATADTKIGLVSMSGAGYTSTFDYVRVTRLR